MGVPELKAGAKAAGGSLNDAYVAALLGGFRRYHESFGQSVESIPMGMPISMRTGADANGGNRFAAVRFNGPVAETDPAKRIRQVREIVLGLREEPALDALDVAAPILARLPNYLLANWYLSQSTGLDLQASNVAGVPVPVYLAGAKIERMFPFGPAPVARQWQRWSPTSECAASESISTPPRSRSPHCSCSACRRASTRSWLSESQRKVRES
ncbi:hypothetical protein GCM10020255_061650 [Rhodococcus baikonurensis]